MDITPALTTFGLIAMAEMGDKTQLIAIALASRYSRAPVFAGLILAFTILTAVAVGAGEVVLRFISPQIIGIAAGMLFIFFGIITLVWDDGDEDALKNLGARSAFFTAFSMIALAEIGDKTQIALIALSAQYHTPIIVFFGAWLALCSVSALGVVLGSKLSTMIPIKKLRAGSGILFIIFGIMFLIGI